MIDYIFENNFKLTKSDQISNWIEFCIHREGFRLGEINYIFCNDDYLLKINNKILKHNTLTDIISLDYSVGDIISGDIFISSERIEANAIALEENIEDELNRVMIHGVLHYCGYKDKTESDKSIIRKKEDYYLSLRTF